MPTQPTPFAPIDQALRAIADGRIVVVVDEEDRENEGDLIMAAEHASPEAMAFFVRHTSGVICAALDAQRLDELELPLMVASGQNGDKQGTAFTVSVDARAGTSTGISAADRSATVRALASESTTASELVRPGHVFPLRARAGGVLRRAGHTEAAVDLARLAGCRPVGVLAEVVNDDGTMARLPDLRRFCGHHGLLLVSIAHLVRHRRRYDALVTETGAARIPTAWGEFTAKAFTSVLDSHEHVAYVLGEVSGDDPVLVRVHSECLTGDALGSERCDCGSQLQSALEMIGREGRGVLVYLRGHEGRGIGLAHKLRAYGLQDEGADTVDANLALGLPVDARGYGIGAHILASLGVRRMRLMTNNPAKYSGLAGYGLELAERVPLPGRVTTENVRYLSTKRERMGHLSDVDSGLSGPHRGAAPR